MKAKLPAFLTNADKAFRWAKKHTDAMSRVDTDDPDWNEAMLDEIHEDVETYVDFAHEVLWRGSVAGYRIVRVPRSTDVRLDRLGKYWSRYPEAAGVQGQIYWKAPKLRDVLIEAIIPFESIDWTHGFESFLYYGEDQWEIAGLANAPVLVTAIDGEQLGPPVEGNIGPFQTDIGWRPNPL